MSRGYSPEDTEPMDTTEVALISRKGKEPATSKVKEMKLDTFRVIHLPTIITLEIETQFQSMAKTLGIWDFLLSLWECYAYKEATNEFLSTFRFGDMIVFKLLCVRYRFTLEAFNQTLSFASDGVHEYDGDNVKDTWAFISRKPASETNWKSNAIRHNIIQYFHCALSNSVFARGDTQAIADYKDLFFIYYALHRLANFDMQRPDVGDFLANHLRKVINHPQATGSVGLAGVVHYIAQRIGFHSISMRTL